MTCRRRNNNCIGFACVGRNFYKPACRTPIIVSGRINRLQCGTGPNTIFDPNSLNTFENLDWNFDQLFEGRSFINVPCDVGCPVFRCDRRGALLDRSKKNRRCLRRK